MIARDKNDTYISSTRWETRIMLRIRATGYTVNFFSKKSETTESHRFDKHVENCSILIPNPSSHQQNLKILISDIFYSIFSSDPIPYFYHRRHNKGIEEQIKWEQKDEPNR